VFSREIRTASFPQRFRQPTLIDKYTGETDPVYGSTTTAWHVNWAEPPPTRSSSATCRCTSLTRHGRGSSIYRPARYTTGMIWSAPSWGTSRARTYALEIPGTCACAPRSSASHFWTSYGASPSAARSSRAWPSPRSCTPSSRARPAGTSCASSGAARRSTRTSCSTSPPARLWRGGGGGHLRREEGQARGRRARGGQRVQGAPVEAQAKQERQEVVPQDASAGTRQ
jgi:hypothetical protein